MEVRLWSNKIVSDMGPVNDGCPSMSLYLLNTEMPSPVIIVYPGGSYTGRAAHEGEPVAIWLNHIGVSAIVLNYRVAPHRYPIPFEDAQQATRTVRYRAEDWNIDPKRVGVLGFSAGGHLAAMSGTHFDNGNPTAVDPIQRESSRPDILVLCYPVITMGQSTHVGSKISLLGDQPDPDIVTFLSAETQVTPSTPPAFVWHTADDEPVPVENSLLFAGALARSRVPYELHVFESGPHGLGLAEGHRGAMAWTTLCESWLRAQRFL